jgi:predicted phosphodiesterase
MHGASGLTRRGLLKGAAATVVGATAAAAGAHGALRWLVDRRIRMHSLIAIDPPPAPVVLRRGRATVAVTGAVATPSASPDVVLRAWAPTPTLRILDSGDATELTARVDNVPAAVRLVASGPVDEERLGISRVLRFPPQRTRQLAFSAPARDVTFAALGDTGDSQTFAEALRVAARDGADFLLHLGDLIYEDVQMPAIQRLLAASPVPVFMTRGNHDYRNQTRIDFIRTLGPPYYAFQMGGATFVVLDNGNEYVPGFWSRSTQYQWWQRALAMPWAGPRFVVMHKPPFDRRATGVGAAILDRPLARQLMRDFVRARVDAVVTGHVHGTYLWEDGVPYVVHGDGQDALDGTRRNRMAWVRVSGRRATIEQVSVWDPAVAARVAAPDPARHARVWSD